MFFIWSTHLLRFVYFSDLWDLEEEEANNGSHGNRTRSPLQPEKQFWLGSLSNGDQQQRDPSSLTSRRRMPWNATGSSSALTSPSVAVSFSLPLYSPRWCLLLFSLDFVLIFEFCVLKACHQWRSMNQLLLHCRQSNSSLWSNVFFKLNGSFRFCFQF